MTEKKRIMEIKKASYQGRKTGIFSSGGKLWEVDCSGSVL